MAKKSAVWGIDIGQCALKAIRCTLGDDGETIVADAFDYIEYPKLLTQPEADPEELVREALQQFLSRNPTKGDKVAVAVSGQSGLARFIKLPPVEVKKIPDIVKYEAKQQIPFKLEEVIWDYQQLPGTIIEEGFAMEAEVGLFAMKREQVFRAISPYEKSAIELDIVQLAPLSIYNAIAHDTLPEVEAYDSENPPEYMVVLSIGTETTDLVITNGYRVWQRSIPLGGNHFTKQLTKELKLTFAKAEHLKRNARQAEDPKAIFQAMRPVFNDLEKEVRRSINFFRNNDRNAQLGKLVLLGNTTKLPGLPQYLEKNLEMEVIKPEAFNKLSGPDVVDSPAFKENVLAFPVCYGLALQGLGKARLATNLVPRELLTARLIKGKKPWAVAALAVLLFGLMLNFVFHYLAWNTVKKEREVAGVTWITSIQDAQQVKTSFDGHAKTDSDLKNELAMVEAIGEEVIGNADGRLLWIELLRAINAALPLDPKVKPGETPDPQDHPFGERPTLYITSIESQYFEDLSKWFADPVKKRYAEMQRAFQADAQPVEDEESEAPADPAATEDAEAAAPAEKTAAAQNASAAEDAEASTEEGEAPAGPAPAAQAPPEAPAEVTAPTGAGWVIELKGYHYYNLNPETEGSKHLRQTLIRSLEEGTVWLPGLRPGEAPWTMKELGIAYPIIAQDKPINRKHRLPNPEAQAMGDMMTGPSYGDAGSQFGAVPGGTIPAPRFGAPTSGPPGANVAGAKKPTDEPEIPRDFEAPKYEFVVQFAWQEKKLSGRLEARDKAAQALAEAQAAAAGQAPDGDATEETPAEGDAAENQAPENQPVPENQALPENQAIPANQPGPQNGAPPAGINEQPPAAQGPPGAAPPGAVPPGAAPPGAVPPGAAPAAGPPGGGPAAGPPGAGPAAGPPGAGPAAGPPAVAPAGAAALPAVPPAVPAAPPAGEAP
jgi:type IV pilus assembly protein PilM